MKFEKGKRTYVWPLSVTDVVVKRLVRHCHVPCCSHKYKYNYKYTHTQRYTNHEPDDQNSPKRTEEACKKLPRALLLSQIQIQVQILTQTYTMMTNMVVKTKEACKTLLRAALTEHCKTLPLTDHCTVLKAKDYTPFQEAAGDIFWRDSAAKAENWSPL